MRKIIFVATSIVAVSLLAACSGVGTPAGGGPTDGGEPPGGDNGTPGDSDDTPEVTYNKAKNAMKLAIDRILAVVALPVNTASEKQDARAEIRAAETQYRAALMGLEDAVEGLEAAGSQDLQSARSYLRGITLSDFGQRLVDANKLAAETWAKVEGAVPNFASFTPSDPAYVAEFERVKRAEDDGTVIPASRRLRIPDPDEDGVMHSAGKFVFSPDGTGTTDELPMRSLTIRSAGGAGSRGDWVLQGRDGTPIMYGGSTEYNANEIPTGMGGTDGILIYSVEITAAGLVYKAGGNAAMYDFQRRFNFETDGAWWYGLGPDGEAGTADDGPGTGKWDGCYDKVAGATPDCTNWVHDDIIIEFGQPSYPGDVNAFFWQTRIPLPPGTSQDEPGLVALLQANDGIVPANLDLGAYRLWISNYGGLDRGDEYADGTPHPDDDVDRFLKYAAYGVFTYTDLLVHTRTTARQQGFHFGYDTFANREDLKTTDIEADNVVEATFRGSTFGVQSTHINTDLNVLRRPTNLNRIRGDITLNARIGSGANKISGEITGVEVLGSDNEWVTFNSVLGAKAQQDGTQRLVLTGKSFPENSGSGGYPNDYSAYAADIKADGSYEGGVYLQQKNNSDEWERRGLNFDPYASSLPDSYSIFGGTIYGPRDGDFENIETAGYWYLHGDKRRNAWGGIVGSFGAVRTD